MENNEWVKMLKEVLLFFGYTILVVFGVVVAFIVMVFAILIIIGAS